MLTMMMMAVIYLAEAALTLFVWETGRNFEDLLNQYQYQPQPVPVLGSLGNGGLGRGGGNGSNVSASS